MCPVPISAERLLVTLRDRFQVPGFRPGQEEVIRAVLDGRPVLAVMPTGAGKSLCYQLPSLLLDGLTVVVSPLISLMQDQLDKLSALGVSAARVDSTMSSEEQRRAMAALGDSDGPRIVFVAPERFRSERFLSTIERAGVALFAVDEAHCISQWGHDFRPDYARLGEVVRRVRPARVAAFTATATPRVREDITRVLGMPSPDVFVRGFDRANLHLSVVRSGGDADKRERLERLLDENDGPALIYTATRKRAEQLAATLRRHPRGVRAYHAGLDDDERASVQRAFMEGRIGVVVATSAFGMGVDKRDVRLVVHHELPRSVEAYYQEAGRGGRDGLPARCVLLFNPADIRLCEYFIDAAAPGLPLLDAVHDAVREDPGVSSEAVRFRVSGRRARISPAAVDAALRVLERQRIAEARGSGGWHLIAGAPPIDYAPVEALRAAERDRLDQMIGYAQARACRRAYLLDYFGDPAGRTTCNGCDLCGRAPAAPLDDERHLVVRKVLSCVARLNGGFGRKRIALVLEGSLNREVTDAGLERVSTFGVLAGRPHGFVMELLGALEAAGLVSTQGDEYPTVALTAVGREVMHDRARSAFEWPREVSAGRTPKARSGSSRDRSPPRASDESMAREGGWDLALLERLRVLRRALASEAALPAYCIFHDRTLEEIARARPRTTGELAALPGIGPNKLQRFGPRILDLLRQA